MPLTPVGKPTRTGMPRISSANSRHPFEEHRAAREDDARRELLEQPGVLDALANDREHLFDAGLDDVREDAARGRAGA